MTRPPGEPPWRRDDDDGSDGWDLFDRGSEGQPEPIGEPDESDTQVIGTAPVDGDRPHIDPDELAPLQDDDLNVRRGLPLEDEPSDLVARYLFPTERYRGEWRKHVIHLFWPITIALVATFALGWLSGFLARQDGMTALSTASFLLWLAAMGYLAWKVADWHFDRFILTNKRVMVVKGIITRNVAMMPLLRVTDMKYEQTPLGRILNYGTFVLESAGQDQALREVPHLPNPNELYLRVVEEMYEPAAVEARLGRNPDESEEEEEEERRVGDS